nr:hypothetical protein [Valsa mali var. pyri (nom. inval.)]
MRKIKLENKRIPSQEEKLKQVKSLLKGESTIVIKNITGETQSFVSNWEAAKFIGINQSGLSKYISKKFFYLDRGFFVYKSSFDKEMILNSDAYKKATGPKITISRHTETSKVVIRDANLENKLSFKVKEKLIFNSKLNKKVIAINDETKK